MRLFQDYTVFIIDTVSSISIIQPGVCYSEVRPTILSPFGVTGNELEIKGVQEVEFYLNNRKFSHQFCVCSLPPDADGFVGMHFLSGKEADLNFRKLELRMSKALKPAHDFVSQGNWQARGRTDRPTLIVFATRTNSRDRDERFPSVRDNE